MSDNPATRHIHPGEAVTSSTGKLCTIQLKNQSPQFLIDGHSHIQSGACCPLPLIWAQPQIDNKIHPHRKFLNFLTSTFMGDVWKLQKKGTEEIAAELVDEIKRTCGPASALRTSKDEEFLPLSLIMPMAMDFAHTAGFDGSMIYHESDTKVICYLRSRAFAPETHGEVVDLTGERPNLVWVYQHYIKQYRATRKAVLKYPWKLIPMFHYDPRRWMNPSGGAMDHDSWRYGPWDYPFKLIATPKRAGLFIGFKMYPPLGYKPLDPRLPHLRSFYKRCIDDDIPILTHCSPGGLTTHEAEFFHKIDKVDLSTRIVPKDPLLSYNPCTPKGYFFHEYVHPKNWRTVLENGNKDLRLCLAHCGGDEWINPGIESDWIQETVMLTKEFPNVYTDVACYDLGDERMRNNVGVFLKAICEQQEYRHLRDKLLFGVDWYLSMITKAPEYKEYVDLFYSLVKGIDEELWLRMTVVNPAKFYRLDDQDLLTNMNKALKGENADSTKRESGFSKLLKLKNEIAVINSLKR